MKMGNRKGSFGWMEAMEREYGLGTVRLVAGQLVLAASSSSSERNAKNLSLNSLSLNRVTDSILITCFLNFCQNLELPMNIWP
jgi:hypothetical protein